ncbi:hydrolase [Streptomyces poriferorum]|uniref:Hydrolase n=1 Tax=Streptomyces poriferorum TaxID=2798799 RepID=A0ABY9ISN7_9ACTN|nr:MULTISPECIES: acyl-CoA dehydrogenase family protein [unclassified Streptomyces]MDP5312631.1 hydrolase [Streptomyces sp. Alt4]WLQ48983.1 hydrolase [Streptomyces sp. Alt1]WLQ58341.1 hydrolase [Streptomyces sp. Alt2]
MCPSAELHRPKEAEAPRLRRTSSERDLLDAVPAASSLAAQGADAADRDGRLAAETVAALTDAGFHRLFVPPGWGGFDGTFTTLVTTVAAVGEGCASAAWVAAVFANFGRLAGFLPQEGQRAIWGNGADARLSGAVAPSGRALPAPGGWLLSGRWQYVSGASFSDWALLAGRAAEGGGEQVRFFAVPRREYEITGTWSAPGMRGTGSDTVRVEGAFVAKELSFPRGPAAGGTSSPYRRLAAPSAAVTPLCFVSPALGAASAALAAWAERLRGAGTSGKAPTEAARIAFARSTGEVDAARLLVDRVASGADRGRVMTRPEVARHARDAALAMDLVSTAVSRLYRLVGTSGQSESRFQRPWRDITTAAGHALLDFEAAGRSYTDELITSRKAAHGAPQDARSHRG